MEREWEAGDDARVRVAERMKGAPGYRMIEARPPGGTRCLVHVSALHPLPRAMSAEDAAVLEAAHHMEKCRDELSEGGNSETRYDAFADARTKFMAAVRSRAAKQEAGVQQFRVGDVVRVTAGGFTETGWSGTVFRFYTKTPGELVAVVNFGERMVGYLLSQLEREEDDLHADGDPSDKARIAKLEEDLAEAIENCAHWASDYRELQAGNRADEEGRRVAGLLDRVVTEFMKLLTHEGYLAIGSSGYGQAHPAVKALVDLRAALTPPAPVDPRAELDAAVVDVLTVVDMSVRSNAEKVARVSRARAAMAREAK